MAPPALSLAPGHSWLPSTVTRAYVWPKGCPGCPLDSLLLTASAAEDLSCWGKEN